MSKKQSYSIDELSDLKSQFKALQKRVTLLEDQLEGGRTLSAQRDKDFEINTDEQDLKLPEGFQNDTIESRIGEHGMAWLGNIVLLFGIIFLMELFHNQGVKYISALFGFTAVAGVYLLGFGIRKHYPVMSGLFTYNGHILMFYVFLRLHFISDPVIGNKIAGLILPLLVFTSLVYLSYRQKSQILFVLTIIMGIVIAIFSNSTHVMMPILTVLALLTLFFTMRLEWWTPQIISIFLVYLSFLIWLLGNPFISHTIEAVKEHQLSYLYLFGFAFIYSMLALLKPGGKTTVRMVNSSIVINGLGFSFNTALIIFTFLQDDYILFLGLISLFCMAYAVILQWRGDWKLPSALYALYGFVVLSITVSIYYRFPLAFLLLSIQSLLVVSMALWFRSRFVVIMNLILFVLLLITYLALKNPIHSADFSFALVALITARVINWKKERLEIRTEFIRNIYLFAGFVMVLVSLYHAVPDKYESLSWTLAALLYFLLSIILQNVKYRFLAIATMIATAFHVFLFDLKNIGIGYRVLALMFLAAISLGVSVYYARRKREKISGT